VAALEFTDYAFLWWENLKIQRRRDGEEEITMWATIKGVMRRDLFLITINKSYTSDFRLCDKDL
jgi:hypothetical protein